MSVSPAPDLSTTLLADAGARVMSAGIKPLRAGWHVHGRALTVSVDAGDNLAIHAALAQARPGEVLVIDAQGYLDRAVMGGIMCAQAAAVGLAGVIIDGAMRDLAELRAGTLPAYALGGPVAMDSTDRPMLVAICCETRSRA
ncbi:RraA family protein, partial [Bordetella bronchiseptica]